MAEVHRAMRGHRILIGLVIGSSGSAALGALLVAIGCLRGSASLPSGAAFTVVVGLVFVLRALSHANSPCRTAVITCGIVHLTAAFVLVAATMPEHAGWAGIVAIGAGLASLTTVTGVTITPIARRAIDLLEYLALASVVPLACWVADVYGLTRGLNLG